jgi:hypothetical protein
MLIKNFYEEEGSAGSGKTEELDKNITDQQDKTIESETVITGIPVLNYDDIDLDKVDELLETQTKTVINPEEKPVETKTDDIVKDEKIEEQPDKTGKEEDNTESGSNSIHIDDKYISEQSEDIQEILKPLLNKVIKDSKGKENSFEAPNYLLQNYIHAEKHIKDLKSGQIESKELVQNKQEIKPDLNSYNSFTDEEVDNINNLVQKELEYTFPDIRGENAEGVKQYLADLNQNDPEAAHKFVQMKNSISARYTNTMAYYKYVVSNHDAVVNNQLMEANNLVKEKISKMYNIKDVDALLQNDRYNFVKTDEKKSNPLLNNLTKDEKSKSYLGKGKNAYVMYSPEAIANNFINIFASELNQIARAEAKRDGYQEAIERRTSIKVAPSISNAKLPTPSDRKPIIEEKINYDMDTEQMNMILDKQIEEMKRKH